MENNGTSAELLSKHLQSLMYQAPAGFLMVDEGGNIIFVNRLVEKMFNYRKEELIGQPVEILIPESFSQRACLPKNGFHQSTFSAQNGKREKPVWKSKGWPRVPR